MPDEQKNLDVEEIIEKAFDFFERFVNRSQRLDGILLEGLEPQDDGWIVSIGFNGKRQESTEPASIGSMAALTGFGNKTTKTVKEIRHIYLDHKGAFKRMD